MINWVFYIQIIIILLRRGNVLEAYDTPAPCHKAWKQADGGTPKVFSFNAVLTILTGALLLAWFNLMEHN